MALTSMSRGGSRSSGRQVSGSGSENGDLDEGGSWGSSDGETGEGVIWDGGSESKGGWGWA